MCIILLTQDISLMKEACMWWLYVIYASSVLQGLLRYEMQNFSRLALIVTSQSRSSLHQGIVASRGLHFVQDVIAIQPPNKVRDIFQFFIASVHLIYSVTSSAYTFTIIYFLSTMEIYVKLLHYIWCVISWNSACVILSVSLQCKNKKINNKKNNWLFWA